MLLSCQKEDLLTDENYSTQTIHQQKDILTRSDSLFRAMGLREINNQSTQFTVKFYRATDCRVVVESLFVDSIIEMDINVQGVNKTIIVNSLDEFLSVDGVKYDFEDLETMRVSETLPLEIRAAVATISYRADSLQASVLVPDDSGIDVYPPPADMLGCFWCNRIEFRTALVMMWDFNGK